MKTILITGSTDGIGKLSAEVLAKQGHRVVLHGRNSMKLENTLSELRAASGNEALQGYVSDLSDFTSIEKMITQIKSDHNKLDILINNAGVFKSSQTKNAKGLDLRFAVNYLAPYVLTNGLLDLLKKAESPRLINLSSAAQSSVSLAALDGRELLLEQAAYAQSKLALTMWSFEFAKTHPFLTVIALNPGSLLNTKMVQEAYGQYWSSADKGAKIICDMALSERYSASSGTYFDNDLGNFNQAHQDAYDEEKISELLRATEEILAN